MNIICEIHRRHSVQKQSISVIAREMGLSRLTVRNGEFGTQLTQWLKEVPLIRVRRRTAHRLFAGFRNIDYGGAFDSV